MIPETPATPPEALRANNWGEETLYIRADVVETMLQSRVKEFVELTNTYFNNVAALGRKPEFADMFTTTDARPLQQPPAAEADH